MDRRRFPQFLLEILMKEPQSPGKLNKGKRINHCLMLSSGALVYKTRAHNITRLAFEPGIDKDNTQGKGIDISGPMSWNDDSLEQECWETPVL